MSAWARAGVGLHPRVVSSAVHEPAANPQACQAEEHDAHEHRDELHVRSAGDRDSAEGHQFQRPSSTAMEGTNKVRTKNVSRKTANAIDRKSVVQARSERRT